jgi:DNA-binding XRE family transcriptional regulator
MPMSVAEPAHPHIDPAWMQALAHPLRVKILVRLLEDERASPVELAATLGASLGVASYHVRRLRTLGFIVLVGRTQVRGSLQHHYELTDPHGTREGLSRVNAAGQSAPALTQRMPRLMVPPARVQVAGELAAWSRLCALTAELRRRREQRGITRATLAERVGIPTGALGRIERGEADPRMSVLVKLAAELGTSLPDLLAHVPVKL